MILLARFFKGVTSEASEALKDGETEEPYNLMSCSLAILPPRDRDHTC